MDKFTLTDCQIITLPKLEDPNGSLTFIESLNHIPFDIKRIFYMYDIPGGSYRGAHAHKELHQFIVATSGSFDVELDSGNQKERFNLNRSYFGLYVPPMTWGFLDNFSTGAVCMVLASGKYDETDYIRDYNQFIFECNKNKQ
jgi:hypothetical protein